MQPRLDRNMTLLFQCHREVPPCLASLDRNENLDGTGRRAWETGQSANSRSTIPVPTPSVQGKSTVQDPEGLTSSLSHLSEPAFYFPVRM